MTAPDATTMDFSGMDYAPCAANATEYDKLVFLTFDIQNSTLVGQVFPMNQITTYKMKCLFGLILGI